MHTMDRTPKIITIIGLIVEGFGAVGMFFAAFILRLFTNVDFFLELDPTIPVEELDFVIKLYTILADVMVVMGIIIASMVAVNIFLFVKLMRGKFDEKAARKVYLYQLIWGIFNLFFNTITGILYIVSGYQGRNNKREMVNTREGI